MAQWVLGVSSADVYAATGTSKWLELGPPDTYETRQSRSLRLRSFSLWQRRVTRKLAPPSARLTTCLSLCCPFSLMPGTLTLAT